MFTTAKRKAFAERKSNRYSQYGREQERNVLDILKGSGIFSRVILHEPNSIEDTEGKDFTVWLGDEFRSFGITISCKCWKEAREKHPDIPQMLIPLGITPQRVIDKVHSLFDVDDQSSRCD